MQVIDLMQEPYFSVLARWSRQNAEIPTGGAVSLVTLTAKLASLYLEKNKPPVSDLPVLIDSIFQALKKLMAELEAERAIAGAPLRMVAMEPRRALLGARQRRRR